MGKVLYKYFTVVTSSDKRFTAEVSATLTHDPNYGADADGNRGMPLDFIEDINLTIPIDDPFWEHDDNGEEMTKEDTIEAANLILDLADKDSWEERVDVYSEEGLYH